MLRQDGEMLKDAIAPISQPGFRTLEFWQELLDDRKMVTLLLVAFLALAAFVSYEIKYIRPYVPPKPLLSALIGSYYGRQRSTVDPRSASKASLHTETKNKRYPRLSRPLEFLKPSYDVVVIGSGYGGGVAASRFARAGKTVCVLERGAEKWPGEYPHTARGAIKEYEVSGQVFKKKVRVGKGATLYQTVKGEGQDVFMGCGLGGTSLINGGVWLRSDERILRGREWPAEIRENGLDDYYDRAERMFRPKSYPLTCPTLLKLSCLENQARNFGVQDTFYRPPITTSFTNETNQAGIRVRASTGSGNECTGTNDGSKNSVLITYLADAWARGAELFCGIDVKYLEKRDKGGGYVVFFEVTEANGARRLSWVIAVRGLFLHILGIVVAEAHSR
jgi:hypothetical protein